MSLQKFFLKNSAAPTPMNKQRLFSLIALGVFATVSSLAGAETVRTADFEQTKTMQGLNITLKANGTVTSRAAFRRAPQKVFCEIFTLVNGT